jgi:cell division FtsZ-interacting protein ZapD
MIKTYDQCLKEIDIQVKRYKTFRRNNNEDKKELQDLRDNIAEALLDFGPYYAQIRSNAEACEVDRKLAYGELKQYAKKKHTGEDGKVIRGTADEIEADTLTSLRPYYDKELEANKLYYKCRVLMERVDQELNSISSRLKLLQKDG